MKSVCRSLFVGTMLTVMLALPGWAQQDKATSLPQPIVPQGFGINIHFTDPQTGEMERFREAGYAFARMDLFWGQIESEKGKYDFAAYDRLVEHLAKAGARALFILDYGNDLYQKGSPSTPEARAAFAKFAAEAARHFQGKGVIFEIWNEPNIAFWQPKPNADDYAALALETAKSVRAADPKAVILAPGSSSFPWEFFETVFRSGLLAYIDGVSVHPYRGDEPETVGADYARLRALIARFAPPGKSQMPIISSEWGYSTREGGNISEEKQAQYITRMWLTNLANGVNLSIFYDWRDDGNDPKENEHRFGTVRQDFTPKPSFLAAQRLIRALRGYNFRHRLWEKSTSAWKLLFQKGDGNELAVVTWNASPTAPEAEQMPSVRPVKPEDAEYKGLRRLAGIRFPYGPWAFGENLKEPLTATYTHYGPDTKVNLASIAEIRQGTFGSTVMRTGEAEFNGTETERKERKFTILNRFTKERPESMDLALAIAFNEEPLPRIGPITAVWTDPITLSAAPANDQLMIQIENPSGIPFRGGLVVSPTPNDLMIEKEKPAPYKKAEKEITFAQGQTIAKVFVPLPKEQQACNIYLRDSRKNDVVILLKQRFMLMPEWKTAGPSDFNRVRFVENAAQQPEPLTFAPTPDQSPSPMALKFDYTFDKGWQYAQIAPAKALAIPKNATALILWVLGDGSGNYLRARFKDSTGQTFQKDLGQLVWRGWRPITIHLDGQGAGVSWGGANDRVPHNPLAWDGLLLVDSASRENPTSGLLLLASPYYALTK